MISFDIVSALTGMLIGLAVALGSAYILFQPRQSCKESREECMRHFQDIRSTDSGCLTEIKSLLMKLQCEMTKHQKMLMSIIVALPVEDSVKRDLLKG